VCSTIQEWSYHCLKKGTEDPKTVKTKKIIITISNAGITMKRGQDTGNLRSTSWGLKYGVK
jgi:hypothetical protein